MIRTILLAVLAVLMISSPATAFAEPDQSSTVVQMLSNMSAKETTPAYAKFIDTVFTAKNPAVPGIQVVPTNHDVTGFNQISLIQADDLLHNKDYGSPVTLVFYMGQIKYNATHVPASQPLDESAVLAGGCYGGVAMSAFGHTIGVSFDKPMMDKVNNLLRTEYGDELAKLALRGRAMGLSGGIIACDGVAHKR